MPKNKILLIDDSQTILNDISRKLTDAGYEVIVQNKALGSSQIIINQKPDLVILDVNMPTFSGPDLLQTLREGLPKLPPILLFSEIDPKELQKIASEKKADDYLCKAEQSQLISRIEKLLKK